MTLLRAPAPAPAPAPAAKRPKTGSKEAAVEVIFSKEEPLLVKKVIENINLVSQIKSYTDDLSLRGITRGVKESLKIPIFTRELNDAVTNNECEQMFALRNFLNNYLNLQATPLSMLMCKDQLKHYGDILIKADSATPELIGGLGTSNRFIYKIGKQAHHFRVRVDSDKQNRIIALAMFQDISHSVRNTITIDYPSREGATEVITCLNGNKKAKVLILPNGNRYKEWEKDSDGNEKATGVILPNGNRYVEWERSSDGNDKAKVLISPSRNIFEEWERSSDGNEKAKVLILPNENKVEEWERDSDGNEKAKVVILPNEQRYENYERDSDGNEKAAVIILANKNRYEDYQRDSARNQKAKVLILNKERYEEWEIDSDGNQKAKVLILRNGTRIKNWTKRKEAVST